METFKRLTPKDKHGSKSAFTVRSPPMTGDDKTQQNNNNNSVVNGSDFPSPPTSPARPSSPPPSTSSTSTSTTSTSTTTTSSSSTSKWKRLFKKKDKDKSSSSNLNDQQPLEFNPSSSDLKGISQNWAHTLKKSASKLVRRRKDTTAQRFNRDGTSMNEDQMNGPIVNSMSTPNLANHTDIQSPPVQGQRQHSRGGGGDDAATSSTAHGTNNRTITKLLKRGNSTLVRTLSLDSLRSSNNNNNNNNNGTIKDKNGPHGHGHGHGHGHKDKLGQNIGNPTAMRREIHITWNQMTGQFEGVPDEWSNLVQKVTSDKLDKTWSDRRRCLNDELAKCEKEEKNRRVVRDRRERARLHREERRNSVFVPRGKGDPTPHPSSFNNQSKVVIPQVSLWCISGNEVFKATKVALSPQSLSRNDVFVLDCGQRVYVWIGPNSSIKKQVRGLEIASKIKYESQVIVEPISIEILIDGDRSPASCDQLTNFLALLNGGAVGDDQVVDLATFELTRDGASDEEIRTMEDATTWLYRVSNHGKISAIDVKPLVPTSLNCNTCFILDCETDIFVWNGRRSHPLQQRVALIFAKEFLHIFSDRPAWATVHIVHQDEEAWEFKERFLYWLEEESVIDTTKRNTIRGKDAVAHVPFPPIALDAQYLVSDLQSPAFSDTAPAPLLETRRGKAVYTHVNLDLWRCEADTWTKVPTALHGHFSASRAYVCHHIYMLDDTYHSRAYFWQGAEASIKWWIVFQFGLYKELHNTMVELGVATPPPTECLTQHKESGQFIHLFADRLIVHRESAQLETHMLYQLAATPCGQFVKCAQFPRFNLSCLNSRHVFILYNVALKTSFIWYGRASSKVVRDDAPETARLIHQYINRHANDDAHDFNLQVPCEEGKEPKSFWKQFGSYDPRLDQASLMTSYTDLSLAQTSHIRSCYDVAAASGTAGPSVASTSITTPTTPKFYHIYYHSRLRKYVVTKIKPFCQSDLSTEDAFVLDCHSKLFVWLGPQCSRRKRETSEAFARQYIAESITGHSVDTPVAVELCGAESFEFRSYFEAWNDAHVPQSLRNNAPQALVGTGAEHRLLNSIASDQIQVDDLANVDSSDDDEAPAAASSTSANQSPSGSPRTSSASRMEKWEIELEGEMERLKKRGGPSPHRSRAGTPTMMSMPDLRLMEASASAQNGGVRKTSKPPTSAVDLSKYVPSPLSIPGSFSSSSISSLSVASEDDEMSPRSTVNLPNSPVSAVDSPQTSEQPGTMSPRGWPSSPQLYSKPSSMRSPPSHSRTWAMSGELEAEVSKLEEELVRLDALPIKMPLKDATMVPDSQGVQEDDLIPEPAKLDRPSHQSENEHVAASAINHETSVSEVESSQDDQSQIQPEQPQQQARAKPPPIPPRTFISLVESASLESSTSTSPSHSQGSTPRSRPKPLPRPPGGPLSPRSPNLASSMSPSPSSPISINGNSSPSSISTSSSPSLSSSSSPALSYSSSSPLSSSPPPSSSVLATPAPPTSSSSSGTSTNKSDRPKSRFKIVNPLNKIKLPPPPPAATATATATPAPAAAPATPATPIDIKTKESTDVGNSKGKGSMSGGHTGGGSSAGSIISRSFGSIKSNPFMQRHNSHSSKSPDMSASSSSLDKDLSTKPPTRKPPVPSQTVRERIQHHEKISTSQSQLGEAQSYGSLHSPLKKQPAAGQQSIHNMFVPPVPTRPLPPAPPPRAQVTQSDGATLTSQDSTTTKS
ncbi:hypothetical protein SAMD00019534_015930 [Acytostelium subglobosum LB1]|uniref:hypothetical protein n=1 Tax=Acytostelium subglobosum LB1 TaxID=1410327 RepID=UPI0006452308|nr:hypothetical protein SAMD00019534_015930 [Acytostelium subglobosum LB1]GAM18418.1 hypothetical protein SAMD00019534_015930 [Acytostelium subglobosum LB1]|eukprot:XP_012757638.1 hypothetical protein SAMD00019534_015930 [Acytostelium subglobosum LB1]